MNFEHYKNFVAIIDAGTISAASKELLIAQPALSNQIKSLEDAYGAQLVVRQPRHIELTDAGKILYDKIKSICYLEDSARKEIEACVSGNRGTLRFGCSPSYPDPLLQQILFDYHNAYPEVCFEMFEHNSNNIIEMLQSGIIEVALIRFQAHLLPPEIRPVLSFQERIMANFHRDHEILSPAMEQVPLHYLKDLPISISHGLTKTFTSACEHAGFEPNYMNVSTSRFTSSLWVADKRTVAIVVGSSAYDLGDSCMREIAAEGLLSQRMFAIDKNRKLSSVAESFLQFIRQHKLMDKWALGGAFTYQG